MLILTNESKAHKSAGHLRFFNSSSPKTDHLEKIPAATTSHPLHKLINNKISLFLSAQPLTQNFSSALTAPKPLPPIINNFCEPPHHHTTSSSSSFFSNQFAVISSSCGFPRSLAHVVTSFGDLFYTRAADLSARG